MGTQTERQAGRRRGKPMCWGAAPPKMPHPWLPIAPLQKYPHLMIVDKKPLIDYFGLGVSQKKSHKFLETIYRFLKARAYHKLALCWYSKLVVKMPDPNKRPELNPTILGWESIRKLVKNVHFWFFANFNSFWTFSRPMLIGLSFGLLLCVRHL